ncbi:MAG: DUF6502 family protein [Gammaproteobacteria bacterium]|nr:DUF6502 family protein [Gammaproteobacteria bacterium]MDH3508173.1 DUF6502 family protein [Gammaproteobacteria bacterium]
MADSVRSGLLGAFRVLMRPLVRILIRNGITHNELSETLKLVYVDVADVDFAMPDRKASQSRVAILTGLSRKEVAKQIAILQGREGAPEVGNLNRVTRILQGWHTDAAYTGPYGMPRELPLESGDGVCLSELIRRYCDDASPQAMIGELVRVGVIEQLPSLSYKVLTRAYVPESLHPDALERLGTVVRNFVNTIDYNMETDTPATSRFERVVVTDNGLREDLLPVFDRLLRIKGQQLLVELDNWLSSQESDAPPVDEHTKTIRTGVGIYHFTEEED